MQDIAIIFVLWHTLALAKSPSKKFEVHIRRPLQVGSTLTYIPVPGDANKPPNDGIEKLKGSMQHRERSFSMQMAVEILIDHNPILGGRVQQMANRSKGDNTLLPYRSVGMTWPGGRFDMRYVDTILDGTRKKVAGILGDHIPNRNIYTYMLAQHPAKHGNPTHKNMGPGIDLPVGHIETNARRPVA
jgi:hypothetical protein